MNQYVNYSPPEDSEFSGCFSIKVSLTSGLVGIWWINDGKVVADAKTLDEGYNDGNFINYDARKNHSTEWRSLIEKYFPKDANRIINRGIRVLIEDK